MFMRLARILPSFEAMQLGPVHVQFDNMHVQFGCVHLQLSCMHVQLAWMHVQFACVRLQLGGNRVQLCGARVRLRCCGCAAACGVQCWAIFGRPLRGLTKRYSHSIVLGGFELMS
jgi:hypothetical protein